MAMNMKEAVELRIRKAEEDKIAEMIRQRQQAAIFNQQQTQFEGPRYGAGVPVPPPRVDPTIVPRNRPEEQWRQSGYRPGPVRQPEGNQGEGGGAQQGMLGQKLGPLALNIGMGILANNVQRPYTQGPPSIGAGIASGLQQHRTQQQAQQAMQLEQARYESEQGYKERLEDRQKKRLEYDMSGDTAANQNYRSFDAAEIALRTAQIQPRPTTDAEAAAAYDANIESLKHAKNYWEEVIKIEKRTGLSADQKRDEQINAARTQIEAMLKIKTIEDPDVRKMKWMPGDTEEATVNNATILQHLNIAAYTQSGLYNAVTKLAFQKTSEELERALAVGVGGGGGEEGEGELQDWHMHVEGPNGEQVYAGTVKAISLDEANEIFAAHQAARAAGN